MIMKSATEMGGCEAEVGPAPRTPPRLRSDLIFTFHPFPG